MFLKTWRLPSTVFERAAILDRFSSYLQVADDPRCEHDAHSAAAVMLELNVASDARGLRQPLTPTHWSRTYRP